jgi:hypothetical protein
MTIINCDCPLNIEHFDHTSVEEFQFRQWPWVRVFQILHCFSSFCAQEPPIPFVSKLKKVDKVDGPDADKSEWIKLEILMDPDNPAWGSKYSRQFAIFKDGCPEDWIKWVMAFREI